MKSHEAAAKAIASPHSAGSAGPFRQARPKPNGLTGARRSSADGAQPAQLVGVVGDAGEHPPNAGRCLDHLALHFLDELPARRGHPDKSRDAADELQPCDLARAHQLDDGLLGDVPGRAGRLEAGAVRSLNEAA
jgi:hypothetical protein